MKYFTLIICILGSLNLASQHDEKGTYLSLYKKKTPAALRAQFLPEAQQYGLHNGQKVLDIGGSDGSIIIPMSMVADTIDYYLEDIQDNLFPMVPRTIEFVSKIINPKVYFTTHTILSKDSTIPIHDVLFDRILVREAFHHFSDKDKMLQEIKRLMAENGELRIIEPDPDKFKHCQILPADVLIKIVTEAGFTYKSTVQTYGTSLNMTIYTFTR